MEFDPMDINYIRMDYEEGQDAGNTREIKVKGLDIREMNFGFLVGDNSKMRIAARKRTGLQETLVNGEIDRSFQKNITLRVLLLKIWPG
jgi:hypothetical protein